MSKSARINTRRANAFCWIKSRAARKAQYAALAAYKASGAHACPVCGAFDQKHWIGIGRACARQGGTPTCQCF